MVHLWSGYNTAVKCRSRVRDPAGFDVLAVTRARKEFRKRPATLTPPPQTHRLDSISSTSSAWCLPRRLVGTKEFVEMDRSRALGIAFEAPIERLPIVPRLFVAADSTPLFSPWFTDVVGPSVAIAASKGRRKAAAYIGASNGDLEVFFQLFVSAMDQLRPNGEALTPVHVRCISDEVALLDHCLLVAEEAAIIVLAGGDVRHGWDLIRANRLHSALHKAAKGGAVILGLSAGAIHMASFGYSGFNDEFEAPFPTLGLIDGVLFGAHEEADDWRLTRMALTSLEDGSSVATTQTSIVVRNHVIGVGVSTGGCAAIHPDGSIEPSSNLWSFCRRVCRASRPTPYYVQGPVISRHSNPRFESGAAGGSSTRGGATQWDATRWRRRRPRSRAVARQTSRPRRRDCRRCAICRRRRSE